MLTAMKSRTTVLILSTLLGSCSSSEIEPIEIHEEDSCSFCRMAISDDRFAGEIVTESEEVLKFDDIGCMVRFREQRLTGSALAFFVKDYDSRKWLKEADASIIQTGIGTPMNSGLVAFADSVRARAFAQQYPHGE